MAFKCDADWDELFETENDDVRFCGSCQREVFFCHSDLDIAKNIKLNRCIAFISEYSGRTLGMPWSPSELES